MPWVGYRELRRIERERREAVKRAEASEAWAKGLVNSILTAKGHAGVPVAAPETKHYTPPPMLPDVVQGWTQEEFIDTLTADGTYKSRGEAIEAWQRAQRTGKFPYQSDEEFLS